MLGLASVSAIATADSDVDLLVQFDRPVGLFHFFHVQRRLEEILGACVDVVMRDAVKPQLRECIFAEAIRAAYQARRVGGGRRVTRQHGLSASAVAKIVTVLARFPEVDRVVLFGSRAKGTHKPGSDIDLALVGERLDWRTIGRMYDELDDLLLPFRFSLVHYGAATDPDVAGHIARVGILLFEREGASPNQYQG